MAYEGVILTTSILQALGAIPQTIASLRTLLSTQKPDTQAALEKLEELRSSLKTMEDISGWLEEAKRHHELLQNLDEALEPIRFEYIQATIGSGRFDPQKYRMNEVRQAWRATRNSAHNRLTVHLHGIRRIEKAPLVIDQTSRAYVSGPEWAYRFIELECGIEEAFVEYEKGELKTIVGVANLLEMFDRHVKYHMHLVDERIREEASTFARTVLSLTRNL